MTGRVAVRLAGTADVAVLVDVGQTSFRQAYEDWSEPDDLEAHLNEYFSEKAVLEAMQTPDCRYLLASNNDKPAGFVKIRDGEIPDTVPANRALELQQVYVNPDQQRSGIGGRLLAAALQYAAEQSADGVWLSVWEDAPWAINAYLKHGFRQVGTVDFPLGATVYNDLLMWCPVRD